MTEARRIFWDAYGLDQPYSGVFVHARMLAAALFETGTFQATVVGSEEAARLFPEMDRIVLKGEGGIARIFRAKPLWSLRVDQSVARATAGRPHILHGLSNFNVPFLGRTAGQLRVLTVHDIIPLLAPDGVSKLQAEQFKLILGPALKAADRIVCVSEWTRHTLSERYPDVADRTVVIRNGVPGTPVNGPMRPREADDVRILAVARYEPYKRLDQLVRILRALPERFGATLLTSGKGVEWAQSQADDLIASGRLTVKSALSRSEMMALYADADMLVHTSRFEGFCLPAVDALEAGRPVVYQSGSAMDEFLNPSVGVALAPDAPLDQWVHAVETAATMTRKAEWPTTVQAHYGTLPTWKDAAQALQALYKGLQ